MSELSSESTSIAPQDTITPPSRPHKDGLLKRAMKGTNLATAAASLSLLISSGFGNVDNAHANSTPDPIDISTTLTECETTDSSEYDYVYASGLIKIAIDKNGNPVNYTPPNGETVFFDQNEIAKLKQEAIDKKEPEILKIIPLPKSENARAQDDNTYSKEHPRTDELPEDVLSNDELEKRGLRIIQAPDTTLYIRRGAFELGGPFQDLAEKRIDLDVEIVLVNGPIVAVNYMQDPRYKEFLNHVPQIKGDVNQFRLEAINNAKFFLKALRAVKEKPKEYENLLLNTQIDINNYENMTDEEIMRKMPSDKSASGKYVYNYDYDRDPDGTRTGDVIKEKQYIFVAVGKDVLVPEKAVLYFDSDGKFLTSTNRVNFKDASPLPSYTHPNPEEMKKNPNVNTDNPYIFDDDNTGLTFEHEEVHRETLNTRPYEKTTDEMRTDYEAGRRLSAAFQKWVESGYTDNSGYHFVFSITPEKGGGYILVNNTQNSSTLTKAL